MNNQVSARIYILFAALVVFWALSFPITKIGLDDMPPTWFAASRSVVGLVAVLIYLIGTNQFKLPTKQDVPFIMSMGLSYMGVFMILVHYGMELVGSGRSAILIYTTPLWVAPAAVMFFGEKISKTMLIGLLCGFAGILVLFNPWSFDWSDKNIVIGHLCLIVVAMGWAAINLHTRYGKWEGEPITLLPWQLLVATTFLVIAGFVLEPTPQISWTPTLIGTIFFNGVICSAFGFFAMISITRAIPVITTSLGMLGVPIFGFVSSAIFLDEPVSQSLLFASILIVFGLAVVATSPKTRH